MNGAGSRPRFEAMSGRDGSHMWTNQLAAATYRDADLHDSGDALARTLLAHYVPDAPADTAQHLRGWLAAHEVDLFFSDRGDYRW